MGQLLMNERTIFTEALERETPTERSAYLDAACAGDEAIRGRVEALLRSLDQAGTFLRKPVPERLGEALAADKASDDTQTGPSAPEADEGLDFLEPSDKPGVLGRLGHYEVLEVLGRGGMGVVLRVFDEQLHRVVAIKVMAAHLATHGAARRRFTREARAAAAVSHDHVVTIHAVEDVGPRPHIVMQYVAGASLQERLDRTGPLPLPEILRIGMQAAAGLAAAHAQGLVHRDVKPANILMENGVERVKITDFGLARAADDASLTQSGAVAGTPSFMSPEQAAGKPVDHRSDLFSLGSVLYAMCTGRPPFRAGTSMGVLKRVCEETPTPIRATNPEMPDWLAAVVEKLHAKDPAARFQSAAEVAENLGQHLAHVQHPSVMPLTAAVKSTDGPPAPARPARRNRRLVAAAVLVAMFAVLGVTEATGVTNVRATIVRVFTPDGTLVVETDDPDVKVTVEGDGGLIITGAGLQEIRLKPGSYRVLADRDGKRVPLDRELVTVSRRGREIVRVKLEALSSLPNATAEKGAFVLLAAGNVRKFDTLAEAVLTSADGDTIEVHGNGPFVLNPIVFNHALTIRAGSGFRPMFTGDSQQNPPWGNLLFAFAPLRLEGLEIHSTSKAHCILQADSQLWVAGCSLTTEGAVCIGANAACEVRNSVLVSPAGCSLALLCSSQGTSVVTNNLLIGQVNLQERDHSKGATLRFTGNTIVSPLCNAFLHLTFDQPIRPTDPLENRVHLSLAKNVIDCCSGPYGFLQGARPHLSAKDAELWLRRRLDWRDENNCYQVKLGQWIQFGSDGKFDTSGHKTLADWNTFWGLKANGSLEDELRFLGGNLIDRVKTTREKLTPEHFRLRSDSAGYRAGKDGKDIGADVDLIGTGPAYERWKKTPEYQQWLKETGQIRAEKPRPEPGAFVVIGGKGVAERKFDTLAEAVASSSDGDTIEVRGNGPFVSDGAFATHSLVIRAGSGYVPAIILGKEPASRNVPLIGASNGRVVLEGLELMRVGGAQGRVEDRFPQLLLAWDHGSLHIANCRLIYKAESSYVMQGAGFTSRAASLSVRNAVLTGNISTESSMYCESGGRYSIDNCVCAIGGIGFGPADPDVRDVAIRVRNNTLVGNCLNLTLFAKPNLPGAGDADRPLRLAFSGNVARWDATARNTGFLFFHQAQKEPLAAAQAEAFLPRLVALDEKQNVYRTGTPMLRLVADWQPLDGKRGQDLADWNRFWGQKNTGSVEGEIRFQGGDLIARARSAPEKLAAEDFRLRPDSAGYRAGKDGKDLGADVDLVGPGAAYERWKQTPEYQEWLKETGQKK